MDWTGKSPISGWGALFINKDDSINLNIDLSHYLGYSQSMTFQSWSHFSVIHLPTFPNPDLLIQSSSIDLGILGEKGGTLGVRAFSEQLFGTGTLDGPKILYFEFSHEKPLSSDLLTLFDAAPTAMVLASTVTAGILKANKEFLNWIGLAAEIVFQSNLNNLFSQKREREEFFMDLGRQGFVRGLEAQIITQGSRSHWALVSGSLVDFENQKVLLASFVEIDRQKESERILKGYNSFLEALLSGTPDPVFYSDREGNFSGMNKAFMELTGYGRGHWIGQRISAFLPEQERTKAPEQWLKSFTGQSPDYELEYSLYEGQKKRRFLISRGVFSGMDGKPEGMVFILKDITDLKNAEESLRSAMERAEEANLAKTAFLANMSHEIRTPLNIILGFSDILSGSVMDPVQQNYLENIKTSGRNLLLLINDILDLSKIEAGKMQLSYDFVDLIELIREVLHIFSLKANQVGLKLNTDLFLPSDRLFRIDEVRFRQILFNLIGNAVKFTPKGSVTVEAKAVQGDLEQWTLSVKVRDTGIGIQKEAIDNIFNSFQQADNLTSKKFGGTGLGLSITRRLVQMMDGEVEVTSDWGAGSVFSFSIPGIESKVKMPLLETKAKKKVSFKQASILVVEDNAVNRLVVKEILKKNSANIFEAEDGAQALAVLEKHPIDLVLMDIRMEKMDGVETAKQIAMRTEWKHIPIIVLTALTSAKDRQWIEGAGFSDFLTKPVDPKRLVESLKKFLPFEETDLGPENQGQEHQGIYFNLEDKVSLGDLGLTLLQEFAQLTEEVRRSKNIGRIRQLAQSLLEWSEVHKIFFLQKWSSDLITEVQGFQLKTVDERLGAFAVFLSQIGESNK